jgi:hypothetical protein
LSGFVSVLERFARSFFSVSSVNIEQLWVRLAKKCFPENPEVRRRNWSREGREGAKSAEPDRLAAPDLVEEQAPTHSRFWEFGGGGRSGSGDERS